jgi:Carboxypeptidase regulatory-like domain
LRRGDEVENVVSTLGLAATVASLIAAGLVAAVLICRRRRAPRPAGPRTVADLVRLRADAEPARVQPAGMVASEAADPVDGAPDAAMEPGDRPEPPAGTVATGAGTSLAADAPWLRARRISGSNGAPAAAVAARPPAIPEPRSEPDVGRADTVAGEPEPEPEAGPEPTTATGQSADAVTAAPKVPDGPSIAASAAGGPVTETPMSEASAAVGPVTEARMGETSTAAAPLTEAPVTEAPMSVAPAAAAPLTEAGVTEAAVTAAPAAEAGSDPRARTLRLVPPVSEIPVADGPVSAGPVSEVPASGGPVAEVSAEPEVAVPAQRAPAVEPIRERRAPAVPVPVAGGTDFNLRRTFGLLGPAPDGEAAITLSGSVDADRPPPDAEMGPSHSVRFRVVRRDGTTVAGAAVNLLDDHGRETGTGYADVQGCGEIRTPHPGRYMLIGTAPGHRPGAAAVSTVDGPAEAEVLLVRSAALSGSVRGTRGPIAGATLTLMQDGDIIDATQSGLGGAYRIQELDAGGYGLSVDAEGWEPFAVLLDIDGGADVHRDVELAPAPGSISDKSMITRQATVDRKVAGGH